MSGLRSLTLALALLPGLASAQGTPAPDADAPIISLPSFGAPPADAQEAAPETAQNTVPEAPPETASPDVVLTPPPAGEAEAPAVEEVAEPEVVVTPVERDGASEEALASDSWLLSPRPASRLPQGVQFGASLPEPGILRLTGEVATTTLLLDLPAGQAPDAPLQLSLRSSVNVLPDLAKMTVQVNDAAAVELPLDRLAQFGVVEIPSAGLAAGANRITLTLNQPHRIFCGPEATFEVWTELALAQSGARVADEVLTVDAAGFALAALSQTTGGHSLPLLADDLEDPAIVRALSTPLRRAMGSKAGIDVRSFYDLGPQPLASVALIASDRAAVSFRRGAEGGIVLQVEHKAGELPDLTEALAGLAAAGAAALAPAVAPGQAMTLTDLGAATIIGDTHYFRQDVAFSLPGDWLLMANQMARLDLQYGFAKGMPQGSILMVKVNGETVRLLPLDKEGGEVLPPLPISFKANILRPDRNALTFEMMVPGAPATEICPVRRTDFLAILGDSTLTVPPSPAMVLPGLASVLLRLDPGAILPAEGSTDERALTILTQQIAGQLDASALPNDGARIHVARLADLPLVPLETSGLNATLIQNLLFPKASPVVETPAEAPEAEVPAFSLDDEQETPVAPAAPESGIVSEIWQSISPGAWLSQEVEMIRASWFTGSTLSLADWTRDQNGTALLIRPDLSKPGDLWLILGPGAEARQTGAALNLLRENSLAQGEAALLDDTGAWKIWSPSRPPVLLETPGFGSIRAVIGNFASWSPLLFTLSLILLALISAVPALLYVLLSRREGGAR